MNLAGLPPLGVKPARPRRDREHMAKVRALACVICDAWGFKQLSETQAHHAICGRFSQRKSGDRMAVALCRCHHLGNTGTGRLAIHKNKSAWIDAFGLDTDWVAVTLDKVESNDRVD